jgi:hypothetical protein
MISFDHMPNKNNDNQNESDVVSEDSLKFLLEEAVARNLCTGAAAAVGVEGKTLWSYCVGTTGTKKKDAQDEVWPATITPDTRFDVASLTKPLSTALLTLKAFQAGALKLDDPVEKFLPEMHWKARTIPLIALLTHTEACPQSLRYIAIFLTRHISIEMLRYRSSSQ